MESEFHQLVFWTSLYNTLLESNSCHQRASKRTRTHKIEYKHNMPLTSKHNLLTYNTQLQRHLVSLDMAIKNRGITGVAQNEEMSVEEFKKWLKHFDMDKDGKISKEELQEAVYYSGKWFGGFRSRRALRAADSNSSGFIEDHEVEKLIEFAKKHLGKKVHL